MEDITRLTLEETVRLDPDRLNALYSQLGEAGAEDIVCRAMEELAVRMAHCERLHRLSNWAELRKSARSLVAISDQIGMHMLSRVAGDVTMAVDSNDTVAIAATLARLLRIGERSLTAIWDTQDLSL